MNHKTQEEAVLSVSQLNVLAKDILESSFANIMVEGEISNLMAPRSGHIYFSLKDDKSQIRVALFAGQKLRLNFKLENGQKVIVKGGLSLYTPRGDYQLIAKTIEPSGEGALRQQFERLKQELNARGWFDEQHKKPLPEFCKHLAVVTSPSGAAIRDILHVLERRFPLMEVTVIPSLVQGKDAAAQLVKAIETANRLKQSAKAQFQFDVILLARGGGSLEDLWSFNEEKVASAVFYSELPIISGVGHEIDYTICDWVADFRAPTPSAAAESLSQDQQVLMAWLEETRLDLSYLLKRQIEQASLHLKHISKRCVSPQQLINQANQKLDFLEQRLVNRQQSHLIAAQQKINSLYAALKKSNPLTLVKIKQQSHQFLSQRLISSMHQSQNKTEQKLAYLAARLNSLSPLNTLERGYTITRLKSETEWKLLNKKMEPSKNQFIQTETHTHWLESQVTKVTKK